MRQWHAVMMIWIRGFLYCWIFFSLTTTPLHKLNSEQATSTYFWIMGGLGLDQVRTGSLWPFASEGDPLVFNVSIKFSLDHNNILQTMLLEASLMIITIIIMKLVHALFIWRAAENPADLRNESFLFNYLIMGSMEFDFMP